MHVVFGEVIDGKPVVDYLHQKSSKDGKPLEKITIANCGAL
jgi:cyclophilin family peptidyl-prolyl cis-trans isomerase